MVLKANLAKLFNGDLVLKAKLVLILAVIKAKFDCSQFWFSGSLSAGPESRLKPPSDLDPGKYHPNGVRKQNL